MPTSPREIEESWPYWRRARRTKTLPTRWSSPRTRSNVTSRPFSANSASTAPPRQQKRSAQASPIHRLHLDVHDCLRAAIHLDLISSFENCTGHLACPLFGNV